MIRNYLNFIIKNENDPSKICLGNLELENWIEIVNDLKGNKELRKLTIAFSTICTKKADMIKQLLESTESLKVLEIYHNNLENNQATEILAEAIKNSKSLTEFSFNHNIIGAQTYEILQQAVQNTPLSTFEHRDNKTQEQLKQEIVAIINNDISKALLYETNDSSIQCENDIYGNNDLIIPIIDTNTQDSNEDQLLGDNDSSDSMDLMPI